MLKKSADELISDVIVPIEQNDIDSGKLYVLIRSQPNQSCAEYEEGHWSNDFDDWPFPTESGPREWIEDKQITLETLSGLIWRGSTGGRLYRADFEGEKKKVGPRDYWGGSDDYARSDIEARKHIDECISLGLEVKRARLIRRITNWAPYLLWSFALDCIERAYGFERDLISDIYKEAIIFARAYSKYRCGMGGLELEGLVKVSSANKDFYSLSLNKRYELTKLISEQSELGATAYLKKAVEEQKVFNRIWYALHKKELDWQVNLMSELIGD
jgi:hypothetical protein